MKGADGARYAQITIDASSEFLDSFVSKGDNQNFARINAAFFYKIAHFGSHSCRFTRPGPSDYQRMIFFRKHDFPLFPVERYGRIAGFENVVEIELLRFDMVRNIGVIVLTNRRRFRCKVGHFIECRPKAVYSFYIEIVLGYILVQYIRLCEYCV